MPPRRKPYPVIGIISVSPITDVQYIEDSFDDVPIGAFILQPNGFNVLPELYATSRRIPVYFIRETSPVYLTAIDELHIFCRSTDETPLVAEYASDVNLHVEIHIIP